MERAVLLSEDDVVQLRDLPLPVRQFYELQDDEQAYETMKDFFDPVKNKTVLPIEEIKRYAVYHALQACEGNISEASQKLDISRSTMYRFLEIYNIATQNGVAVLNGLGVQQTAGEVSSEG
jgi:transcriptional regulator of acetoin/glycerol metabolism